MNFWLRLVTVTLVVLASAGAQARIDFEIRVMDPPGFGYNDPTPTTPIGENRGTTLGEQRLIAFRHAAEIWAEQLDSAVPVVIETSFSESFLFLGFALARGQIRDFVGAPLSNTWYPVALANKLAGLDLCPEGGECTHSADLLVVFSTQFALYYGIDGQSGDTKDFVTTALHEIAHGLGFGASVAPDGTLSLGVPSVYEAHLEDHRSGLLFPEMTDEERQEASTARRDLHWLGPNVNAVAESLAAGADSGHVEMYATHFFDLGSSLSHFSGRIVPRPIMTTPSPRSSRDLFLTTQLLFDLGWNEVVSAFCPGDCDENGTVEISEIVRAVRISLGEFSLADCVPADVDASQTVTVGELVRSVNASLRGC